MIENRLKELREKHYLTLKKLSEYVGLKDNTLSQYETGKSNPSLEVAIRLADFYKVSLDYMFRRDD